MEETDDAPTAQIMLKAVLDELRALASKFEEFRGEVNARFDRIEARLDRIEKRIDSIDVQLVRMRHDIADLKEEAHYLDLKTRTS